MKIKVTNILAVNAVYNRTSKQGKPYTIYSWLVSGEVDGTPESSLNLKSMKALNLEVNKEYEVKENTYNGKVSYMIQSENQVKFQKGGYSKPTYTMQEYDALFIHAFKKIPHEIGAGAKAMKLNPENVCSLIATYIISATNAGVKIPPVSPSNTPKSDNPTTNTNKIDDKGHAGQNKGNSAFDFYDDNAENDNISDESIDLLF